MKFKRIAAILVVMAMMATMLFGCNKPVDSKPTDGPETKPIETTAPQETTPPETEPFDPLARHEETVTLTVGRYTDKDTIYDNPFLDFLKDYLNIEIKYELVGNTADDYMQMLNLAITGGTIPDVVFYQTNATAAQALMNELVENGYAYDLTEVYEQYAGEELDARINSYANPFSNVTYDGRIMGIQRNDTGAGEWDCVHIRQDWLEELGIELDKDGNKLITLAELEMVANEFVTKDPGNSGAPVGMWIGNFTAKSSNYSQNLVSNAFGAPVSYWYWDENGNVADGSVAPGVKDAMAWYLDMYNKGLLDPNVGVTNANMAKELFANGALGITLGNANCLTWVYNTSYSAEGGADWITYGLDDGTGKMVNPQYRSVGHFLVVNSECEHPEAVIQVLSVFHKLTANAEFRESIKDQYPEMYELASSNTFKSGGTYYNPFQIYITDAEETYDPWLKYDAWIKGEISDAEYEASSKGYYNSAVKYKNGEELTGPEQQNIDAIEHLGVCYYMRENGLSVQMDHCGVVTTPAMDLYYADMKKCMTEWWIKAITGEVPLDEAYETFVKEYNERGGTEVLEEVKELYGNK